MQTIKDHDQVFQIDTDTFLDRRADCEEILLLSKTAPLGSEKDRGKVWIGTQDQANCPCQCSSRNLRRGIDVYKLHYKFVWPWPSSKIESCDEIAGSDLLKGCYVKSHGSMHLCGGINVNMAIYWSAVNWQKSSSIALQAVASFRCSRANFAARSAWNPMLTAGHVLCAQPQ